jgi:hypothetical protein
MPSDGWLWRSNQGKVIIAHTHAIWRKVRELIALAQVASFVARELCVGHACAIEQKELTTVVKPLLPYYKLPRIERAESCKP